MLQIYKITNGSGIDLLSEHICATNDETKEELIESFKSTLVDFPDKALCLAGVEKNEDDDPILQGFIYAFGSNSCVWISQIWITDEPIDDTIEQRLFFRLCCWAENLGCSNIRIETTDKNESFVKRYQFSLLTKTMRFTIPKDFDLTTIRGMKNGTITRSVRKDTDIRGEDSSLPEREQSNGDAARTGGFEASGFAPEPAGSVCELESKSIQSKDSDASSSSNGGSVSNIGATESIPTDC